MNIGTTYIYAIGITYIDVMTPLHYARKTKGLTQEQLAQRVGVSQGHISGIETAEERASAQLAAALVKVLGRRLIKEEQILYPERFRKHHAGQHTAKR